MGVPPEPGVGMRTLACAARRCAILVAATVASLSGGGPHAPAALAAQPPSPRTHLLIVAGIGGEKAYRDAFHETALAMASAATDRFGLPDSSVIVLAEDPSRAPKVIRGRSTREEIARALHGISTRARPDDQLVIMLIGHGGSGDDGPRFNLPGPDLTAADLAAALAPFKGRPIAIVNAASASGGFVEALAAPGRIVITATKSGYERNATSFAKHFVAAYAGDGADADRNERVSLLEAFTYAAREVARAYEADNRLLTEHARFAGDSAFARRFFLSPGSATRGTPQDPGLTALHAQRDSLERRLDALRGRKAAMDQGAYERELESLLLEVARNGQAIRAAESKP